MFKKAILFSCLAALLFAPGCSQESRSQKPSLKIAFYNVENYFDWKDDPLTNDEEFLPEGTYRWTKKKFEQKTFNIYKALSALGEGDFPALTGLAEVENAFVLDQLIYTTPMKNIPLGYIQRNSPDPRGIDVCMLYRTDKLKLLGFKFIPLRSPNGTLEKTREIVYGHFGLGKESLHVFVNHWPSRRAGESESEEERVRAARTLRKQVDSIFTINPSSKIIIMGDFNDEPFNKSISVALKATEFNSQHLTQAALINLSANLLKKEKTGSLKFQGEWMVFDQIIVSTGLLGSSGLHTCSECAGIFAPPFLLREDKKYMGYFPNRSFSGPKFVGGFSDHLPVFLDLVQ